MSFFTIYLPIYSHRVRYDYEKFTRMFPESLITAALQSGEEEIPLDNPLVTPGVLEVISQILKTKKYTYISDPLMKKRLDYLSIDLPEMVYDSKYIGFTRVFPDIEWTQIDSNYPDGDAKYVYFGNYSDILDYATKHEYWTLAMHLFNHTNPKLHLRSDGAFIDSIIRLGPPIRTSCSANLSAPERTSMILTVLKTRGMSYINMSGVATHGYLEVMKYIHEVSPHSDINYIELMIQNIAQRLDNFSYIVSTLEYIRSVIPNPGSSADIQSLKTYRIFMDVYTGNGEDLQIALTNMSSSFYGGIHSIVYSLLFTAVLTNHGDLIPLILGEIDRHHLDDVLEHFMKIYLAREDLITVKDFTIIAGHFCMELVKDCLLVVRKMDRMDLYEVLTAMISAE